ncbi:MAG: glutamate ligase domain-containing protein [Oscillospiraceae bacterium]
MLDAVAAFYAGVLAGIAPDQCARALKEYEPAGMRQRIRQIDGVTVIEDCYTASPDSMRASLRTLVSIKTAGRRIAVLGDMLELGAVSGQAHREVGELAGALGVDLVVCVVAGRALCRGGGKNKRGTDGAVCTERAGSGLAANGHTPRRCGVVQSQPRYTAGGNHPYSVEIALEERKDVYI